MSDENDEWFPIALLGKPHGLRGIMTIRPFGKTPEEFVEQAPSRVFLRHRGQVDKELNLASAVMHSGTALVSFLEVPDRSTAELLVGLEVVIPMAERPEAPEGHLYAEEMEGMSVVDVRTGRLLGPVLRVITGPANDFIAIAHPDRERDEVLIPLVEAFLVGADREKGILKVEIPDGLLDV